MKTEWIDKDMENIDSILEKLKRIALFDYSEFVLSAERNLNKLRVLLIDFSFIEIFTSYSIPNRWAFHWERKHIDGFIFRHDNVPHASWKVIHSFPWHFHNKKESEVEESNFSIDPESNFRTFMKFVLTFFSEKKKNT